MKPFLLLLGRLVTTRAARELLDHADVLHALGRHVQGDWGDLCKQDKRANDRAVGDFSRILSAYHDSDGHKFWIITEADRSVTTVLLPEDY
jgi:hypothetical protein